MSAPAPVLCKVHQCAMCPTERDRPWPELARNGWRSHYAGRGVEAIKLCPGCATEIENRRRLAAMLDEVTR